MRRGGLPPAGRVTSPEECHGDIQGIRSLRTKTVGDRHASGYPVDRRLSRPKLRDPPPRLGPRDRGGVDRADHRPATWSRVLTDARRRAGRRGPRGVAAGEHHRLGARPRPGRPTRPSSCWPTCCRCRCRPRGGGKKTDKVDTARLQREYLNGELPLAHQPPAWWRQVRRVVACRENLVSRRTALRNWVNRYLAHETWADRVGLWSAKGQRRLRSMAAKLPARDALVLTAKLDELQRRGRRSWRRWRRSCWPSIGSVRTPSGWMRSVASAWSSAVSIVAPHRPGRALPQRRAADRVRGPGAGRAPVGRDAARRPDRRWRHGRALAALPDRGLGVGAAPAAVRARPTSGWRKRRGTEDRPAGGGAAAAAEHLQGIARRGGVHAGRDDGGGLGSLAATESNRFLERQVDPRVEPRSPHSDWIRLPENRPARSQTIIGPSRGDEA